MQAQRVAKRVEFGEDDLLSFISPEKKVVSGNYLGIKMVIIILHLYLA